MKKFFAIFVLFFFTIYGCGAGEGKKIKNSIYSGSWYPPKKEQIIQFIKKYEANASTEPVKGEIIGAVLPHPGWVFSAPVFAELIPQLKGRKFSRVFLLGPSHHVSFNGACVFPYDEWKTPLGNIQINTGLIQELSKNSKIFTVSSVPFEKEHSLEVELPILQYSLGNFELIPVVMGQDYESYESIAQAIAKYYVRGCLFVASSDMSHYHPYENAVRIDHRCLKLIENFDIKQLKEQLQKRSVELCGGTAVLAVMEASRLCGANAVKVLKYANSGDTQGDKSRVVGYSAIVFYRKEGAMLNEEQKKTLLRIARKTIEEYIRKRKIPDFEIADPRLNEVQGAFVTLTIDGHLRGCIGNIVGVKPLWETVRDMAIEAATADPRFRPLSPEELSKIKIEISVLSPLKRVKPEDIVLGRDGVVVKRGFRQGVYLPQVADETGWSKEEFLSSLCAHKAGLSPDAWKDPETQLYAFQALVFSE
ncbi:MAG: AmmeMemoRadiSam system protein B [Elusimicrobia bacterium]|nr:AmmeMemoRadiSam system protein B [Elusimicrobiota bacterium]